MARVCHWRRSFAAAQEGAQAIEVALVMPVLLACLFGVTEFGRALWTRTILQSAVQDAARCAAIDTMTCGSTLAVQAYAATRTLGLAVPASSFSVTKPACGNQVSVSYGFRSVVSQLAPLDVTLSARACTS